MSMDRREAIKKSLAHESVKECRKFFNQTIAEIDRKILKACEDGALCAGHDIHTYREEEGLPHLKVYLYPESPAVWYGTYFKALKIYYGRLGYIVEEGIDKKILVSWEEEAPKTEHDLSCPLVRSLLESTVKESASA